MRAILSSVEPAVFIDRDNTLIANDGDLGDPEQVRLLDGAGEALRLLRDAGLRLVVITNQGGVARGRFTEANVHAVHRRIEELLETEGSSVDGFYFCPFHPEGTVPEYRREHPWRKPQPGMLLQAARDLQLDLQRSWMIGDQDRDVVAGHAAGCRTILIRHEGRDTAAAATGTAPTATARTLLEAAGIIVRSGPAGRAPNTVPALAAAAALLPLLAGPWP